MEKSSCARREVKLILNNKTNAGFCFFLFWKKKASALIQEGARYIPHHRQQNICSSFYINVFSFIFYLIKNHKPE